MWLLITLLAGYVLLSISLYLLFEKVGEAGWKGLVPGLNFVVWCRLIGRRPWHAAWLLFPIVNIFIYAGMAIDMVRSFGHMSFGASVLAVIGAPFYFLYLALRPEEQYEGPVLEHERAFHEKVEQARTANDKRQLRKLEASNPFKKSSVREWAEAIIFAVFAAAFIRMFLIEAYVIPTSSMEGSLLVGDFLFVSKAHYGIRMPETVLQVPLLHNRIPLLGTESYLERPKLPYRRLPALESIDRNDLVVFNYPEGDSVYIFPERTWSIHDYRRNSIPQPYANRISSGQVPLVTRPMDKKDHYIKRCIGLPGDSLEIRDRQVYINGEAIQPPKEVQFMYLVTFPNTSINTRAFSDWGISSEDVMATGSGSTFIMVLSDEQRAKVQAMDENIRIEHVDFARMNEDPGRVFPHDAERYPSWTVDNYGPVYIPQKGATVPLTPQTIGMFRRVITAYEGHNLEERNGEYLIDGEPANSYTFEMDYYWMMGDNRHNSEDSRIWGYVPADHVVGKPLFIWFSTVEGSMGNGIRWNRIFTSADKR